MKPFANKSLGLLAAVLLLGAGTSCYSPRAAGSSGAVPSDLADSNSSPIPPLLFDGCIGKVSSIVETSYKCSGDTLLGAISRTRKNFSDEGLPTLRTEENFLDGTQGETSFTYEGGRLKSVSETSGDRLNAVHLLSEYSKGKETWHVSAYWGEAYSSVAYSLLGKRVITVTDSGMVTSDSETTYSERGLPLKVTLREGDDITGTTEYSYDIKGRLVRMVSVYGDGEPIVKTYSYSGEDQMGNWTVRKECEDDIPVCIVKRTVTYREK